MQPNKVTIKVPDHLIQRALDVTSEAVPSLRVSVFYEQETAYAILARHFPNLTAQLSAYFSTGHVIYQGQHCQPHWIIPQGEYLYLYLPNHQEEAVDRRWSLLWENDQLMAVFKPPMLPVSRTTRNLFYTLISIIRRETRYYDARLLHRLDTETAGILLLAKDAVADRYWKPRLAQLIESKRYQAHVVGVPKWETLMAEHYLATQVNSPIRSQMYVAPTVGSTGYIKPKLCRTHFRVMHRYARHSVIECELFTGRKHQIRAQLAHLGHPIVGDKIYQFQGAFYLKRLDSALTTADFQALGGPHQRLYATQLTLNLG